MNNENHSIIDYWPQFSFDDLDNVEIEDRFSNIVYRSLLFPFRIPEKTLGAFFHLLKNTP